MARTFFRRERLAVLAFRRGRLEVVAFLRGRLLVVGFPRLVLRGIAVLFQLRAWP
jgi:hypothetical protein